MKKTNVWTSSWYMTSEAKEHMVNVCSMVFHTTDVKLGKADHLEVKIGGRLASETIK